MNRHQVLTGACNSGDKCYAVGSVEGIHFTAYAAGCDIVILASDFQRVQIIPGVTHGNIKVNCIDCSTDSGKIAASYLSKVYIFEPAPLLHHESTHKLDYHWYQTAVFEAESVVNCLSWNVEGSKLLTGGEVIQIWSLGLENQEEEHGGQSVKFEVGEHDHAEDSGIHLTDHLKTDDMDGLSVWESTWRCRPATTVYHLKFSPDGLLFASAGKADRLIKIWYEDRKIQLPLSRGDSTFSPKKEDLHYSFVYIAHPRAVTGFSWRKTSKYMPRGSVANMLVTSCKDNVCRIWCETILPDDGLVDLEQFDPNSSFDPKFHTHRHKKRFMQRLKTISDGLSLRALRDFAASRADLERRHSMAPSMLAAEQELFESMESEASFVDLQTYPSQPSFLPANSQRNFFSNATNQSATQDKQKFHPSSHLVRHAIHKRRKTTKFGADTLMSMPNLNTMTSVHDFHKFAIHHNGVAPALHFHLAASVNPETDIPLLPVFGGKQSADYNFQLHWLNNKELQFTMESEKILHEMHKGSSYDDGSHSNRHHGDQYPDSQTDSDHPPEATDEEDEGPVKRKHRHLFKRKHKKGRDRDTFGSRSSSESSIHSDSMEQSSSGGTTPNTSPEVPGSLIDVLDRKIESLLRDWHQHPDVLFSIHPVDGSFLVWLVDWLDEYTPYCFRQAQISFSSRLPHAFPVADARSMENNLLMYCNYSKMDIKSAMKLSESKFSMDNVKLGSQSAAATGKSSPGQNDNMLIPNVLMISKHLNGSLNQWQISFLESSMFRTVVSVAHASRACGHRFRTNTATCHPALPLLITTSHHNIPEEEHAGSNGNSSAPSGGCQGNRGHNSNHNTQQQEQASELEDSGTCGSGIQFCSELILWRVDPVGPLSKSGGIVELARINAPQLSAFSNVAWVPTLLPSTTLGVYSNSPSALFVASDGASLRLYQSVIDARSLLMEMASRKEPMSFSSNTSSGYSMDGHLPNGELFNVVSGQSSSRPGCIIELESFTDAEQDWQQTQLLHVFQEQLVTGRSTSKGDNCVNMEPIVDLRNLGTFEEHFFLVVLEKAKEGGSTLHMWKITIASQSSAPTEGPGEKAYCMDYTLVDDSSNPPSRSGSPELPGPRALPTAKLSFSTTKVLTQKLDLPDDVEVTCASVAAGHLSSSSVYPACLAPYLLVTACSDGDIRFWQCTATSVDQFHSSFHKSESVSLSTRSFEFGVEEEDGVRRPTRRSKTHSVLQDMTYSWQEWTSMYHEDRSSTIHIPGKPITVSCAYTGRIAIAYRFGSIKTVTNHPENRFFNLCVAIYECESTGGSEWVREDTIELKNIQIPDTKAEVNLDFICSPEPAGKPSGETDGPTNLSPSSSLVNLSRTKSVPSFSTIVSARKDRQEHVDKVDILKQKHLVQLDWVSTEDGSHVLTVGVGPKIMMYAQVSNEIVQGSQTTPNEEGASSKKTLMNDPGHKVSLSEPSRRRARLQKSKSMVVDNYQEQLQWMKLRSVELTTADGLPPLPMHMSWVRAGILVVGMDNEMHVYSQWRYSQSSRDGPCLDVADDNDIRSFEDVNMVSLDLKKQSILPTGKSKAAFKASYSMPNFKKIASQKLKRDSPKSSPKVGNGTLERSESSVSLTLIHEFGLFEAARQASPVLPQYHPKSLMELLNFGKVRRVKAILAHLVRCVSGGESSHAVYVDDMDGDDSRHLHRQRTISMAQSPGEAPTLTEEPQLDYVEMNSIPPLPLYALLAADSEYSQPDMPHPGGPGSPGDSSDYRDLFSTSVIDDEVLDTNVLSTSYENKPRMQRLTSSSGATQNPNYFGNAQATLLSKHLTHVHLPGLSSLDQMYLLALADTVAKTKTDFSDCFGESTGSGMTEQTNQPADSLDDCGLRFLLAMRHYIYLSRSLPIRQRMVMQKQGLKPFNLVWAFHSESTEELLSLIPSMQKGEPTWLELKLFGAGWWINNINILKRTMEKVAKAAFQAKKDPMDSSLFYLAMKKKNVLWGLFRSVEDKKMADFFRNDFSQDRWRKAALKNAFALLGRQRFQHAAGFFLLAGNLNDAIEVCVDKLQDIQLALVICRLYDGEEMLPDPVKKILFSRILGCDEQGNSLGSNRAHPDPFFRSMAYWLLKDYRGALQTLLQKDVGDTKGFDDHGDPESTGTANVFNFYNYLRTHPLLIRHRIAAAATAPVLKNKKVIPGFTKQQTIVGTPEDEVASYVDRVTPMERRLFFATAHAHYKNGCPILALEVLSKLPLVVDTSEEFEEDSNVSKPDDSDTCIASGTIANFDENSQRNGHASEEFAAVDLSKPVNSGQNTSSGFDWSQPASSGKQTADSLDWGAPVSRFDTDDDDGFKIDLGSDSESGSESEENTLGEEPEKKGRDIIPSIVIADADSKVMNSHSAPDNKGEKGKQIDIFAQQYKFIACLKVLMEEMQTLATGFEVDGGQLRFQMYIWLEREVEALKWLCHYGDEEEEEEDKTVISEGGFDTTEDELRPDSPRFFQRRMSSRSDTSLGKPTLHEVILAEKMDFEAKLDRMGRRKQWLRQNQQLLRTLVSYCVLQGAGGGGLASVRMELLLLLQELQQEKPQQQLLSPLPFPTTLPLLSAAIASSKTVTADPIQHLQCLCQDLLHTVIEFASPPGLGGPLYTVLVMRNLSIALSSCIYQCLCDSDSLVVSLNENVDVGLEGFYSHNFVYQSSHLMAGVRRHRHKSANASEDIINILPVKWPGVTSLRVLLAREKDEDAPKLNILLCESLIAVYVSLLINAMATYDCHLLYRLTAHKFDQQLWSALFGGGVKTVLQVQQGSAPHSNRSSDELYKQRMKLNMKIMGSTNKKDNKKTYKEKFVPPELSMITYFMTKPFIVNSDSSFSYDSEESVSSEEEEEEEEEEDYLTSRPTSLPISSVQQHTDPSSYAWCLIRYTIVKLALHNLRGFLPQIGIELTELPVCSPLMHAVLRTIDRWEEVLLGKLELFSGPPDNFIPGVDIEIIPGIPSSKYKALLDKTNSPFVSGSSTLPIKRLWFHLIRQEVLRDVFIRYVFRRRKMPQLDSEDSSLDGTDGGKVSQPMKIIHKEQDIITAFAMNQANASCLTLATQKEVVELDISHLLKPPVWLEDENELDIEHMRNPTPANPAENVEFLVVQTPTDIVNNAGSGTATPLTNQSSAASTPTTYLAPGQMVQTGRGTSVVKGVHIPGVTNPLHSFYVLDRSRRLIRTITRRMIGGVRRIGSHPSLPHYLTGSTDGSVRLWEWGHLQPLTVLRSPGNFPKVTKVLFNAQGNKCCVSDSEGQICLWQVGLGSNFSKPIMSLPCHNKTTSDFVFVGSSSLIATAGHSSESRNVCLWDTLLPQRSACVHAFTCHEHGSPAVVYAPHHQLLISGGRKGEICIFDIRQRQMRHTFQAHESPIRCLAMDPEEEFFVTGSAEGDIKVWGLDIHQLISAFPGEHSKSSTFFRNMGSATGVTQVGVGPGHHLFSCGVDGSMKFRALPERESIVRIWTA